jgi:hypothetical protein
MLFEAAAVGAVRLADRGPSGPEEKLWGLSG